MPRLPFGDIGPCEVYWGDVYQSGYQSDYMPPLVITPYLGKVAIRIADEVTDIHEEGKGIAPIDSFFEGTTVELEVPMVRSTLIQLARTIGWQKMGILSGSVLRLDNIAGEEMYAFAETIIIKPICNNVPDPDPHNWIELYKCHPYRDIELGFDRSGQRIHLVKFKVFPSRDSGYEGAGGGGQYLQEGMARGEGEAFEVTSSNKYLDYRELSNGGTERTATMTEGFYSGTTLAAEIALKMDFEGGPYNWLVSYDAGTHKFTITNADFVLNGDFEDWTSPTDADNWTKTLVGTTTINRESVEQHGGDHCVRFDVSNVPDVSNLAQTIILETDTEYVLSFWYKHGPGAPAGRAGQIWFFGSDYGDYGLEGDGTWERADVYGGIALDNSVTTWTKITIPFTSNSVDTSYTLSIRPSGYGAGDYSFYIDDISINWVFELLWKTGPHGSGDLNNHIGTLIGFDDVADDTGASTYTSDNEVP